MSTPTAIEELVGLVPRLAAAHDLKITALAGGLSNVNYMAVADGEKYVIRVASDPEGAYGIDRRREEQAARRAVAAGLTPEVIVFLVPEGHSVVRFVENAPHLTSDQFNSPSMIERLAELLRSIHRLEPIQGTFDPYEDLRRGTAILGERLTSRPERLTAALSRVAETEAKRRGRYVPVLCHNDPYYKNVLVQDDRLWIIDWEYAGMGDPMFDLAGVAYRLDVPERELLLRGYFGHVSSEIRDDLDEMINVYLVWNVVWSLLHVGTSGIEFDYAAFAEGLVDQISP